MTRVEKNQQENMDFVDQDLEVLRQDKERLIKSLGEVRVKMLFKKQELERSPEDPVLLAELKQKEMALEDLERNLQVLESAIAEKEK